MKKIKSSLSSGNPQIGTWISIPSVINVDIISSTPIDFLIFDREHGPTSLETVQEMVIAAKSRGKPSIIRPNSFTESEILNCLDLGPDGIQISNVQTANEVKKIKEFIYYPPLGNRGFSPFNRSNNYSRSKREPFGKVNSHLLLILNVEGKIGIENLEVICSAAPKKSVIFIGAYDLSKSLGVPGEVESKIVKKYLTEASKIIKSYSLFPGTIASSEKQLKELIKSGFLYLPYLADTEMLYNSYKEIFKK
jgi:2-keto-3-deoxy-L-rhamnonate aldolase RhmA